MSITILKEQQSLQRMLADIGKRHKSLALVTTMGALHEGHVSIIRLAKQRADEVLVTIFVNPRQFSANEDFGRYPRMLEDDIQKISEAKAGFVYVPEIEDIYPPGFSTTVSVGEIGKTLEGWSRPIFFDGVATVLAKLFLRIRPQVTIFGEKDYQQLCVVRRLVSDLDLPIEVIGAPTVREADGLAMSSRNRYLSPGERKIASSMYATLQDVARKIVDGTDVSAALTGGKQALHEAGFGKVDYLELRVPETLVPMERAVLPARLLVAAWLGTTRLIDNIAIGPK